MQEEFKEKNTEKSLGHPRAERALIVIVSLFAVIVVSVLTTYSLTVKYLNTPNDTSEHFYKQFEILSDYIDKYAYYDADRETMEDAALKAYVSSAGDRYTVYYNEEDFKALAEDNEGRYIGVGVSVSVREAEYLGERLSLIEVVKVHDGSSAQDKGITIGDLIYSVYTESGEVFADDVGLDAISSKIKGEDGTDVTISVLREKHGEYQKIDFTLQRRSVDIKSVEYYVHKNAADVGVVTVFQFDLKTPILFSQALSALRDEGIKKIVIDMRDNGGGDLNSVIACASYFLDADDLIMSAENNNGSVLRYRARQRTYGGSYASCSVSSDDIGKFKDVKAVILVNGNTASAAELLTAVFRDYNLATIVGTNTFGKGTMQTIYSFEKQGMGGGIKITTDVYFPPCGESYDGVGILPDIVVELEDGENDNQLDAAIEQLKK